MNGSTISEWISGLGMWPLIVVIAPNLFFRRYGRAAAKKRMASLLQAIAVFIITSIAGFVAARGLTDAYLLAGIAAVAVLLFVFRDKVFPYKLKCAECGVQLDFKTIYFMDDNLCADCRPAPQADPAEIEAGVSDEEEDYGDSETDDPEEDDQG